MFDNWTTYNKRYTIDNLKNFGYTPSSDNFYIISSENYNFKDYKFLEVNDKDRTYTLSRELSDLDVFDLDENEWVNITNKVKGKL